MTFVTCIPVDLLNWRKDGTLLFDPEPTDHLTQEQKTKIVRTAAAKEPLPLVLITTHLDVPTRRTIRTVHRGGPVLKAILDYAEGLFPLTHGVSFDDQHHAFQHNILYAQIPCFVSNHSPEAMEATLRNFQELEQFNAQA